MTKLLRIVFSTLLLSMIFPATAQTGLQLNWAKQFGGTQIGSGDLVAVDASGNVYTYGTFKGTVDFDPGSADYSLTSAGMTDLFISKLDASGNFVWAKRIGGSNNEQGSFTIDDLGNVYLTGTFKGTINIDPNFGAFTSTYKDIFIAKLNANGDFIWAKQIQGSGQEMSTSIEVDTSGNIYVLGVLQGGPVDFDPGSGVFNLSSAGGSMFIGKYDSSGNFIWAKQFEGSYIAFSRSVTTDSSGNIYAAGFFEGTVDFDPGTGTSIFSTTNTSRFDIFVLKLDSLGSFLWAKQLGATQNDDEALDIFVDSFNNVYTTGYFEGSADFDPGTGTYNLTSSGIRDVFICKLNSAGGFIWAQGFGGSGWDSGRGLSLDPAGNIYITGRFEGSVDFDPGTNTFNLTSAGYTDVFINKLDNTGNFLSAYQIGNGGYDTGKSIAIDASNNIYLTGAFSDTVDFNPGSATFNLISEGMSDTFILKLNDNLSIQDNSLNQNLQIYPNPVSESLTISSEHSKIEQVQIYDLLGRKVLKEKLNSLNVSLNLKKLTSGIYIVEITAGGKMISRTVVKK